MCHGGMRTLYGVEVHADPLDRFFSPPCFDSLHQSMRRHATLSSTKERRPQRPGAHSKLQTLPLPASSVRSSKQMVLSPSLDLSSRSTYRHYRTPTSDRAQPCAGAIIPTRSQTRADGTAIIIMQNFFNFLQEASCGGRAVATSSQTIQCSGRNTLHQKL